MKFKMFVGKLLCINKVVCYNISGVKYNTKSKTTNNCQVHVCQSDGFIIIIVKYLYNM